MTDTRTAHAGSPPTMPPLDGEGPVYEQIKRALSTPIRDGTWEPGDRIPPEERLADHFDTARMTVHRALRELTEEGLLIRKRRVGTFVARPPAPSALLEIVDMARSIPASGRRYSYRRLSQEVTPAPAEVAEALEVERGSPMLHVRCLHAADGQVVEFEERWINLDVLPEARDADFSQRGPGGWLLDATPWTEAEHTVSATNATAELAGLLEVEPGSACLVLDRRTFQGEAVVTLARLVHPGGRHQLRERFRPS